MGTGESTCATVLFETIAYQQLLHDFLLNKISLMGVEMKLFCSFSFHFTIPEPSPMPVPI